VTHPESPTFFCAETIKHCPHQCSFTPDTEVATEDGSIPIGELEVGDDVLAYNEETGEVDSYTKPL